MSGDVMFEEPRKHNVSKMRVHDYLYDSAFIVSGARDYARTAFKAAMASAQVVLQPVYNSMFSELSLRPRMKVVYHPNCRLPDHIDRSYSAYLSRLKEGKSLPTPELSGKDSYKYTAVPKRVLPLHTTTPDFRPNTPQFPIVGPGKPRSRATQSMFRESSAQTIPWQPDGKAAKECQNTPEVLYLDKLEWGPGKPYRTGDLPADFYTTAIINKMRHARAWMDLVEAGQFPSWMKSRDSIINDVVVKDWIFREGEIDELQDIRLELLHRLQSEQRVKQTSRNSQKLAKLWAAKKQEMERKMTNIRKTRDRELRKLTALHEGGGRAGLVARMRSARGAGSVTHASKDPTSDLHAPLARHGYQARRRHAEILYDPGLLSLEDHNALAEPPPWLDSCGQDLTKSCSGHLLPRDPTVLCERETKWSEKFLENLHNDLKKTRLGAAAMTAGPLHVLKSRKECFVERPRTPEVESLDDLEESAHQAALVLQKIIRGRAVQNLMYEGRTRAAELTEELKTTHGLQKEDKIRIANEESKAREFNARRTETELREDTISALVDELCGGAVSAALDFLEKELRRLKEERRQHAFLMIALREKTMREAAEAGRRQREEHRRREHDEMFKQILGVTQGTVEAYLSEIIEEGVELAAEEDASVRAKAQAMKYHDELIENADLTTATTNEMVAELVQQFLLPHATKTATRLRINMLQNSSLETARSTIFGLINSAEAKQEYCTRCGDMLDEKCRCRKCPTKVVPKEMPSRYDPRWKLSRFRAKPPEKTFAERIPLAHELRCVLNNLLDDVVRKSRADKTEAMETRREIRGILEESMEFTLDARHIVETCPKELPSELRRKAEAEAIQVHGSRCLCENEVIGRPSRIQFNIGTLSEDEKKKLLPSELREYEEYKKCKCDAGEPKPDAGDAPIDDAMTDYTEATDYSAFTYTDEVGEDDGEEEKESV
ncbi:cilia- and flagella-associated protein 91-like isoform X2 [Spodoptera frugiperda]|uniref:Cilia- and flagella-associated protein 91 n=1 Tax=Spodoptera frugiperda TaxID=7108 RepID=A0A9R0E6S0_SPOFR|nr:cilia- and flagella-associated protein 91-like isoform X2 [Spodoptera frugiperda]